MTKVHHQQNSWALRKGNSRQLETWKHTSCLFVTTGGAVSGNVRLLSCFCEVRLDTEEVNPWRKEAGEDKFKAGKISLL